MRAVLFSSNVGDIPSHLAFVNNPVATTNPGATNDSSQGYQIGSTWFNKSTGALWVASDVTVGAAVWAVVGANLAANAVDGVAAGYKLARGVHQQAAASDTIITGLATVVAVTVSWRDTPTLKQMFITGSIGDQAGAPAAGSVLIKTFKPTANNDVTPTAATDFSDNLSSNWVALGI